MVFEVLPINMMHDDEVNVVIVAVVNDTHNMGIIQTLQDVCFSFETFQQFAIICVIKVHDFCCIEIVAVQVACDIDCAEAAFSPLIYKFVAVFDCKPEQVGTHNDYFLIRNTSSVGKLNRRTDQDLPVTSSLNLAS